MGLSAPEDDVFDFAGIELRRLAHYIPDAVGCEFIWTRQVERSSK
jgi:hypothetical protein